MAAQRGIITVADNTFASPWIQRPLELGFDIVMHSATKYLNGHSDMVGGVVVVGDNAGARASSWPSCRTPSARIAGPFDSFLALRGLKTLALRMERHCANAARDRRMAGGAARRRAGHLSRALPAIRSTRWPSARCTASAAWSRRCSTGGLAAHQALPGALQLFTLAESLGGVESLIEHPAIMTHASIPAETAPRSASTTAWCGCRSASRTSTT